MKHSRPKRTMQSRNGAIAILMLLLLPILILFVGFAIDMSYVQRVRSELRSATDLAAKSAAITLSETQDINAAKNKAQLVAHANLVAGKGLTLTDDQIVFGRANKQASGEFTFDASSSTPNAIKIIGSRAVGSHDGGVKPIFGSFYGKPEFEPYVESIASFVDVDICLVLDRSGSMKRAVNSSDTTHPDYQTLIPQSNSRWIALDSSVNLFLDVMDASFAKEKIGLVTFASDFNGWLKSTIDQELTFNGNEIRNKLDFYNNELWSGKTNITAGIQSGSSVLHSTLARPFAIKVMVLFTDGVNTDGPDPIAAAQLAADSGIIIYTITFSDSADQVKMAEAAAISGGAHFHADNANDLDDIFRKIAASLAVLIK